MDSSINDRAPLVVKEIDCFISPDFSKKILLLLHINRDKSRPLEMENIKGARIKATLDHLEMNICDGRLDNMKFSSEKKDLVTLRSIPAKKETSLLGYFINGECHFVPLKTDDLIMDNIKEPIKLAELSGGSRIDNAKSSASLLLPKPTVVSARMRSEAEIFGAKRAASRQKTADNDADLRYLSQLHLIPWKSARFRTYKPMYSFEHRSTIMCSVEHTSNGCSDFTRGSFESLLLTPLRLEADEIIRLSDEPKTKMTLEEIVRSLLVKARVISFDKLLECLRERSSHENTITPTAVIPILNRLAVLIRGWWVVRSDILYSTNTCSEHASVPSTLLIRARDYVMAVFHRGGHLTRKTVSSITKLPSLEVTEILEQLGTRISSGFVGHSNHWDFRQPNISFISSYPDVVNQHATSWELRIRQLCTQLQLDALVTDANQRCRQRSGRISSSENDELLNSISPKPVCAKRSRSRLLSLSPEPPVVIPMAKRARTQSTSSVDRNTSIVPFGGPQRAISPNRPTPPLFSAPQTSQKSSVFVAQPNQIKSPKAAKLPAQFPPPPVSSLRSMGGSSTDLLKQEPDSPSVCQNEPEVQTDSIASMPPKRFISSGAGVAEKVEEPDNATDQGYSIVDDPVICSFVREKLQSHPVLALSELTKACQPFLASVVKQMTKNGTTAPPGSEAEREMLKSELYKVVLAIGGRELHIHWPNVPSALPKQPLFVAPVAIEFGDPSSPLHQAREAILERFENSAFVTYGIIKNKLSDAGLRIPDNTLRATIKRYCVYRYSKYFLRFTVNE